MSRGRRRILRGVPAALMIVALAGLLPLYALGAAGDSRQETVTHRIHAEGAGEADLAAAALAAAAVLPTTGWTATADSEELVGENGRASNVLDGNPATLWHTQWQGTAPGLPHFIAIDTKETRTFTGLTYVPRGIDGGNGNIGQYEIAVSADGVNWGAPVATGTFADTQEPKTVPFAPVLGRHVRLRALTEAGDDGPWSSAGDIQLLADVVEPGEPGIRSRTGWTATADSQEDVGENGAPMRVLDGDPASLWHTQWRDAQPPHPHWITIDTKAVAPISGLIYLPRTVGGSNGRIGGYTVSVSDDNATWTQVATGAFPDVGVEQRVQFPEVSRRYIRLTALTEAGDRGPWSSAAEINLLGTDSGPPPPPPPAGEGRWSATIGFPLIPGAAALLPGNKVLTWSSYLPLAFGGTGRTVTATLDVASGVVTDRTVSETGHDMFCPGTSLLPDGRLVVTGGDDSAKTSIYNPTTNAWTSGANMRIARGYQSQVTMSNGRVFTIGGSWSGGQGGKNAEVYTPSTNSWALRSGIPVTPILTADPRGVYRADNHAWLFAMSGGRVFHAGPSRGMFFFNTSGSGSYTSAGTRAADGDAMNGSAVMYEAGKILTTGGAPAYENSTATRSAHTIDIRGGASVTPPVVKVGSMAYPRAYHNSVVLPDGKVFVVGGQSNPVPFSDAGSAMIPELWDPATSQFTQLAPMAVPRNYHSVALLLPDARVFVGGGGMCGDCATNHPNAEIYSPAYLFAADGSPAVRPAITAAPTTAAAGADISITTDRAVTRFAFVRYGSVTHTVNTDQRRFSLAASGTQHTVPIPASKGTSVPGRYMLFALDAAGVPSLASTITIT